MLPYVRIQHFEIEICVNSAPTQSTECVAVVPDFHVVNRSSTVFSFVLTKRSKTLTSCVRKHAASSSSGGSGTMHANLPSFIASARRPALSIAFKHQKFAESLRSQMMMTTMQINKSHGEEKDRA
jgi:hypothetical protein